MLRCKRCGCKIRLGKRRPPRYCTVCLQIVNTEKRKKSAEARKAKLGTTNLDSEMSRKEDGEPDFDKEKNILKKELRELGLKK